MYKIICTILMGTNYEVKTFSLSLQTKCDNYIILNHSSVVWNMQRTMAYLLKNGLKRNLSLHL